MTNDKIDLDALRANVSDVMQSLQAAAFGFQTLVSELTDGWKTATRAVADIAQDVLATIERQEKEAMQLAQLGWTIPPWITASEVANLSTQNIDEVDASFVRLYLGNSSSRLVDTITKLTDSAAMQKWKPLLLQVGECLKRQEHLVTVPSLLMILEGYIAQFADSASPKQIRDTDIKKAHEPDRSERHLACFRALERCPYIRREAFAPSDFAGSPPSFINRNWILHGRAAADWTMADPLRLLNAISTLDWLLHGL